ncbi:hypothetical protein SAMN05216593_103411 [Pseudomonas asturiensis]|uniref:Uncharacterized protein n=1 Tax=Pseudomonas asturiensis TaxID=1190415 RepID=A0A1M7LXL0_9PSED|nr:hypothetical protein SAMN05216593_103411 [Pseudomonas asturiensis]
MHACCYITHMITVSLAENRGALTKGKDCDRRNSFLLALKHRARLDANATAITEVRTGDDKPRCDMDDVASDTGVKILKG